MIEDIYFYKLPEREQDNFKESIKDFRIDCEYYKKNQVKFGEKVKIKFQ